MNNNTIIENIIPASDLLSTLVETKEFTPCSIRRPGVGITTPDGSWLQTKNQLIELLAQPDLVAVSQISFTGDPETTLWKIVLPEGYTAKLAYVQFRHLPERARAELDAVVCKQVGLEAVLLSRSIPPLNARELGHGYNCVTIKVRAGKFAGWIPGIDKGSEPCASLLDTFVLVGNHYKKK